jgi:hypothetical protein
MAAREDPGDRDRALDRLFCVLVLVVALVVIGYVTGAADAMRQVMADLSRLFHIR